MYVTEPYGHSSPRARVMIPSALSGGSLSRRLEEAAERFGRERVTLAVQRVAEDFFLPSPTGSGVPLSRRELEEKLEQLHPSVFFSHELCARYFTYMSRESGAHFVLLTTGTPCARSWRWPKSWASLRRWRRCLRCWTRRGSWEFGIDGRGARE